VFKIEAEMKAGVVYKIVLSIYMIHA